MRLNKGCVVLMKKESGLVGYGNPQCISNYCEELGTISLYGHNQHYKDYHVDRVIECLRDDQTIECPNCNEVFTVKGDGSIDGMIK